MNLYAYVGWDPVNLLDPSGLGEDGICEGGTCGDIFVTWGSGPGRYRGTQLRGGAGGRFLSRAPTISGTGAGNSPDCAPGDPNCIVITARQCVGQPFASFFDTNAFPAAVVARLNRSDETLILGVSAGESGWGTSRMARTQNNPFGATPQGDATSGISYSSGWGAWTRWHVEWGPRIYGTGGNMDAFLTRLLIDNRTAKNAVDIRGSYNSENPNWRSEMVGSIKGVRARYGDWLRYRC